MRLAMSNRRGQKGPKRGSRRRFPYEPRVVGGKLLMPAELQAIHRYVVETPILVEVRRNKGSGGDCLATKTVFEAASELVLNESR